jgi:antitoxin component YwqK of YwqJK toxin-antitoxin module
MRKIFTAFFLLYCGSLAASSLVPDTLNRIDSLGRRQGYWIIRAGMMKRSGYSDTTKFQEGLYRDSKKTGVWKEYYSTGKIRSAIMFENGRPKGRAVMYTETGCVYEEGWWENQRWVIYTGYYPCGCKQMEFWKTKKYYRDSIAINYSQRECNVKMFEKRSEHGYVIEMHFDSTGKVTKCDTLWPKPRPGDGILINKQPDTSRVKMNFEKKDSLRKVNQKTEKKDGGGMFDGNGYAKLYNVQKQVSKEGIFKDYKLMDGKEYTYDKNGILTRITVYKNGKYVGDAPVEN